MSVSEQSSAAGDLLAHACCLPALVILRNRGLRTYPIRGRLGGHMSDSFPSRRRFLQETGLGASTLALSTMLAKGTGGAGETASAHVRPRARSVIFLFMSGGPSQVDTFDPKSELAKLAGKDVPESLARNVPKIKRAGLKNLLASPWEFAHHGQCGMPIS